ncbi:MAG: ABC transporter ATP-binding protein [Hyphomicrobiaceae bacterium]|nr:ABC transporter ATP-binding protein [Hyphomicrobiaceae bacterium]
MDHLRLPGLPPLTFEIPGGECFAIVGPSGAGKTRLLRAIADLDPVDGHFFLDGAERGEMTAPEWRRRVRYVSAEPGWWEDTPRAHLPAQAMTRVERLASAVGLDMQLLDRPIAELSTGERQRLSMVRALVDEPKVLLLDEPTSALDAVAAAMVEELLRFQLLSRRVLVLVSHDKALIERMSDSQLILPGPSRLAGAA